MAVTGNTVAGNGTLISVVIPVYNVEKYLNRCVESIVNQTYKNLEIILVDDGSPDKCPVLCEQWKVKDNRICVVHKKNQGLGLARNTGIENATGKYLCFVDSDDYLDLRAIETLYNIAESNKADIVIFGMSKVAKNGNVVLESIPTSAKEVYEGREPVEIVLPNLFGRGCRIEADMNLWGTAWTSFYSAEMIKKVEWRFCSERDYISEDVYSLIDLYKNVQRVAIVKEALYFYCENDSSLSNSFKADRIYKIQKWHEACIQLCEKYKYPQSVKDSLGNMYLSNILGALKTIVKTDGTRTEKQKRIKATVEDQYVRKTCREIDLSTETFQRKLAILLIIFRKHKLLYGILNVK